MVRVERDGGARGRPARHQAGAPARRQAEPALRPPVPYRRLPRRRLRPPCARPAAAGRDAALCGLGAGRGLRRRPHQPAHLLGRRDAGLGAADPRPAHAQGGARGHALPGVPARLGRAAAGRRGDPDRRYRVHRLRSHRDREPRRRADLRRLRHQVRLPAAPHLAHRRLSGIDADRHGVPQRLHHQARGLRAGAGLCRHRGADLHRHGDDRVPDLLRRHRERPPPRARLQHDQPDRLHGGGHRHRLGARAQRRGEPRLQRRDLQGPAADVDGRGAAPDRQDQRLRARRALQVHAADDRALHRGRGVDLGLPALLRLRLASRW